MVTVKIYGTFDFDHLTDALIDFPPCLGQSKKIIEKTVVG